MKHAKLLDYVCEAIRERWILAEAIERDYTAQRLLDVEHEGKPRRKGRRIWTRRDKRLWEELRDEPEDDFETRFRTLKFHERFNDAHKGWTLGKYRKAAVEEMQSEGTAGRLIDAVNDLASAHQGILRLAFDHTTNKSAPSLPIDETEKWHARCVERLAELAGPDFTTALQARTQRYVF